MRKALCAAFALSLLVLGACSAPAPTDNSEKATPETPAAPLPASDVMKDDDPAQTSGSFAFDSAPFQGKLTGCSYAQAGTLLVWADELYLYDTASGTVLAHCPAPAPMRDFGAAPFKDGIVLTVMGDAGAVAYIYDSELKLEETLALEELLSGDPVVDPGCVAASSDGNRLAIAGLSALYLYDRPAGQLTTLLDTTQGIGGSSCMATSLNGAAFTPDDDRVAFFGDGFSAESGNGEDSAPVWGTIGIDGSELELDWLESEGVEEMLRADGRLFFPPAISHVDGSLPWVDAASGAERRLAFSASDEGGDGIYVSEQGKYVATAELGDVLTVRVYAVDSGELLATETIEVDDSRYVGRIPQVILLDDAQAAIVLLGCGIEEIDTAVATFSFGA